MQAPFQELDVVSVLLVVDTVVVLLLVEVLLVVHDLLLATSAVDQTTLPETVSCDLEVCGCELMNEIGQAQAMKCYACGKLGHISRKCILYPCEPLDVFIRPPGSSWTA